MRQPSRRARAHARKKQGLGRRSARMLGFEGLEVRSLMAAVTSAIPATNTLPLRSLVPTDSSTLAFLQAQELRRAFERVSDLSQYTAAELNSAASWVVNLYPGKNMSSVASAIGASVVEASAQIVDTYIVDVPAGGYQNFARALIANDAVQYAYPLVPEQFSKKFVPNDTLFTQQWHLGNTGQTGGTPGADANVQLAWDQALGTGVVIGIVDDGLQYTHPDLAPKYQANLSYDFNFNDNDPAPNVNNFDFHGTAVAGVAAAATNNNLGVAGAAPGALLAGLRLIAAANTDQQTADALTYQAQAISIYSNSWGPSDGFPAILEAPGPLTIAAFQQGVSAGRGGKGSIYPWAGGNGRENENNVNYDGYANSRYTLAVAAVDHNGLQSNYSESGSPLIVAAPSSSNGTAPGITTTDIVGANGYNNTDYADDFGGTSSATPLVSGIVALLLQANPNLGWRDVKLILAQSAKKNQATDTAWVTNGIYHVNEKYGFGAIDALAAVNLAKTWTNVGAEVATSSGLVPVNLTIPDNNAVGITATTNIVQDLKVETVEVVFTATHFSPGQLEVVLTSPAGVQSKLAEKHTGFDVYDNWVFSTARDLGESSKGAWKVTVRDLTTGSTGTFDSFQVNIYGTAGTTFTPLGQVAGHVFLDADKDGTNDAGEKGLSGWTVYADVNDNGAYDPAIDRGSVTNAAGDFLITDVSPGTVKLREVLKTDWEQTAPPGGFVSVNVVANQTVTGALFGNFREVLTVTSTTTDGNALRDFILGGGVTTVGNATFVGSDISAGFFTGGLTSIGMSSGIVLTTGDAKFTQGPNADDSDSDTASGSGDAGLDAEYGFTSRDTTVLEFQFSLAETGDLSFNFVFSSEEYNEFANSSFNDVFAFFIDGQNIAVIPGTTEKISINTINGGDPIGVDPKHPEFYHNNDLDDNGAFLEVFGHDGFTDVFKAEKLNLSAGVHTIRLAISDVGDESLDSAVFIEASSFTSIPDPGEIGGTVFFDLDGNNVQTAGEAGIPGVIVYLDLDKNGQLGFGEPAQYTDANGHYVFPLLPPNTYNVRQANGAGFQQVFPANNGPQIVQLELEEIITDANFGNAAAFDYGDAPLPFPTLKPQGAVHSYQPNYYLGSTITPDSDGHPSTNATNDADDDGVAFTSGLVAGQNATVDVTASRAGYLQAWVDFNNDGFWTVDEQIFKDKPVGPGVNHLTYKVLNTLTAGAWIARFRYSVDKGVGIIGLARAGEVEDYSIAAALAPVPLVAMSAFTNTANRYDVNGDGKTTNLDAIILVGQLRAAGALLLNHTRQAGENFCDVTGDAKFTNLDVQCLIAQLRKPTTGGEGEGDWFESSLVSAEQPLVGALVTSPLTPTSAAATAPAPASADAVFQQAATVEYPLTSATAYTSTSLVDNRDLDVAYSEFEKSSLADDSLEPALLGNISAAW